MFNIQCVGVLPFHLFYFIFRCECPLGRTGDLCDLYTDLCLSSPCHHGATCHHEVDRYRCECPTAYAGVNCEIQIDPCDPNPCFHGSECKLNSTVANGYTCSCSKGFLGLRCEAKINECLAEPCKNSGTCVENISEPGYVCQCGGMYTGQQCEVKIEGCLVEPCYNGGQCVHRGESKYSHVYPHSFFLSCLRLQSDMTVIPYWEVKQTKHMRKGKA